MTAQLLLIVVDVRAETSWRDLSAIAVERTIGCVSKEGPVRGQNAAGMGPDLSCRG